MNPKVADLAALIRARKKDQEQPFVILLGAGASMSSGVKSTDRIMQELLEKTGTRFQGTSVLDRFDKLWKETTDQNRRVLLKDYLDDCRSKQPSSGYAKLATLIDLGYFNLVVTFNFDTLLEKALSTGGVKNEDIKLIIRGETVDEEMETLIEAREPRFKLAKLHGSLRSSDHFLFTAEEMLKYPAPLASLFNKITRNDVIVCGYAFNDNCVITNFAEHGGAVVSVDPVGPSSHLRYWMGNRHSEQWAIPMKFDDFFGELAEALLTPSGGGFKPRNNPFKFLESYVEEDEDTLMGRRDETAKFLGALDRPTPPQVIVLAGPGRAGKTSLVKAALLPKLDPGKYRAMYVRCDVEIDKSLPGKLISGEPGTAVLDLPTSLRRLGDDSPGRRVVLFLDQFDRVTKPYKLQTNAGGDQFASFLGDQLFKGCNDNLTLVLVVADEVPGAVRISQECVNQNVPTFFMACPAFDKATVVEIVQALAKREGIEFDPRIIDDLADRYDQSSDAPSLQARFTLAHIQAICHLLASTNKVDHEHYLRAFDEKTREALNQAINVEEIISFVEDVAWPDAAWLRNIIKVALRESKEKIADFIKRNLEDLVPQPSRKGAGSPGSSPAGRAA